jgi:hypothetical protein
MLSRRYLSETLVGNVQGLLNDEQIIEAEGMDAILELLMNLRTVEFPAIILETRSTGTLQLVEGPVDTYTESIWVMDILGRGENEAELYRRTRKLAIDILRKLLDDYKRGEAMLEGWDCGRILYMKRAGGQNARGWEIVLTFQDNISLLY